MSWFIATGVTHRYGARIALDDVGFTVARGQMLALLGPSGAGKTTLFRCLAGLQHPDAGSVHLDGRDVATLRGRERRHIGLVFQQFNLVPRLSALDNVLAGRLGHAPAWRGLTRTFDAADVHLAHSCLERVGLAGHAAQRADTLLEGYAVGPEDTSAVDFAHVRFAVISKPGPLPVDGSNPPLPVMPAKAGISGGGRCALPREIPAFAGMTARAETPPPTARGHGLASLSGRGTQAGLPSIPHLRMALFRCTC